MTALTKGIFIVGAKRTPFGAFVGKLANKTCTDLQEVAARAALQSANVPAKAVDTVVVGNVLAGSSPEAPYISRHVALRVGCRLSTPCLTLNRLCGSGFQAMVSGAHDILMGSARVALTGGADNMSQAPHAVRGLRSGVRLGAEPALEDTLWQALTDRHVNTPMGVTAENLATQYKIDRAASDQFSADSHRKWHEAQGAGHFSAEMAPVSVRGRGGTSISIDTDEHPKPGTTAEALSALRAVFAKDGVVTAGSASGVCDGAAAIVLASESALSDHQLQPLARLAGYAVVGVEPTHMGIGPVPAIRQLLAAAKLQLSDIELVEINEAFAPQTLACQKELGVEAERLNVNGGAIAIGHPLAASGARITAHLVHEMRRRGARHAIGSACIGGGQGIAVLLESV